VPPEFDARQVRLAKKQERVGPTDQQLTEAMEIYIQELPGR